MHDLDAIRLDKAWNVLGRDGNSRAQKRMLLPEGGEHDYDQQEVGALPSFMGGSPALASFAVAATPPTLQSVVAEFRHRLHQLPVVLFERLDAGVAK